MNANARKYSEFLIRVYVRSFAANCLNTYGRIPPFR